MKKISTAILIVLLSYFIFALSKSSKTEPIKVVVNCTDAALTRHFGDIKKWSKWWPGEKVNDTTFSFKDHKYIVTKLLVNGAELIINNKSKSETGFLQFASVNDTSCNLVWTPAIVTSLSLSEKLLNPFQQNIAKENITLLLDSMKNYFSSPTNIYGFKVKMAKVTDPHLISTKKTYLQYPTTTEIYSTVEKLNTYAIGNGAKKTNFPMMNVHQNDDGKSLDVMIALPIDIPLSASEDFSPKFMIQGALLEAEVKGGAYNVEKCIAQFSNFLTDYKLSAPAIPYQSLVIDRSKVLDSNLWITKIYQPVFKK
jgi:hypothetical protein